MAARNISVRIGANTSVRKKIYSSDTTLKDAFKQADITVGASTVYFDGCTLQPGELDKTFGELTTADECDLVAIVKQDNGNQ